MMFGEVPQWVNDWGIVIGLLVGLCTLAGFAYAFTKFAVSLFKTAVGEVIEDKVPTMIQAKADPILERLGEQDTQIAEINRSVNHVGPNEPRLIDRVRWIEASQRAYMSDKGIEPLDHPEDPTG